MQWPLGIYIIGSSALLRASIWEKLARIHGKQRYFVPQRCVRFCQIGAGDGSTVFEWIREFMAKLKDVHLVSGFPWFNAVGFPPLLEYYRNVKIDRISE